MIEPAIPSAGVLQARRRLIEAAQRGDLEAESELLRRFEPLVQRVVRRLRLPSGCEPDDLLQEARIGLLAAIRAWQHDRGPFPAFADRCVHNHALMALKALYAHKHQVLNLAVSLDVQPAHEAGGDSVRGSLAQSGWQIPSGDRATDPETQVLLIEQLSMVLSALVDLTPNERTCLAIALNQDHYDGVAQAFDQTPKTVAQSAYRARQKLAAALALAA